jgi:aspartyl-tRNA(Asn)/glutamyl-tRNA(Gln) amidotransferase subunit B
MSDYTMTIGLEIHAELQTNSKMFCGCKNDPEEKNPNVNICPICMGHPGTLPVINKEAVRKVLQVGVAVGGKLADFSEFDRKNYFYPDIPKDYQISQYKYPLVSGGELAGVALTRVHLEEDTARSSHEGDTYSLVDFNRAGVPLMELVTEPVIHSADQAMMFGRELQLLLQYLGVSDANMEKGEMRVEVNISVSKNETFGTKVEVKNINSFRSAGKAIEYEYTRHIKALEKGEKIVQETRGFDENKGTTFSQRSKEDSHDYRYFPDPDLPKLLLSEIPEFSVDVLKTSLKETPAEKRNRYESEYQIKTEDIETFVNNSELAGLFEKSITGLNTDEIKTLSNYITSDLAGLMKNTSDSEGDIVARIGNSMTELIRMISGGEVSSRGAKDVLKILTESGGSPKSIAETHGLIQKSDPDEIRKIMQEIIAQNQKSVEEYKSGKDSLAQFFVGQGMKAMKGSGNPELIKKIFLEIVSN